MPGYLREAKDRTIGVIRVPHKVASVYLRDLDTAVRAAPRTLTPQGWQILRIHFDDASPSIFSRAG
jgi:hypothetical protein